MRRKSAPKHHLRPDPKYQDPLVEKLVNFVMKDGKKTLAYRIVYATFDQIASKSDEDLSGVEIWKKALDSIIPSIEVKRKRLGGATIQIPIEVRPQRKITLGLRWLLEATRQRHEKTMVDRLSNEILAILRGEGNAVKKKTNMHKMAESNKAFSHFKF